MDAVLTGWRRILVTLRNMFGSGDHAYVVDNRQTNHMCVPVCHQSR